MTQLNTWFNETFDVVEGDIFRLSYTTNPSVATIVLRNANDEIIYLLTGQSVFDNYIFVIPQNTATVTFSYAISDGTNSLSSLIEKYTFTGKLITGYGSCELTKNDGWYNLSTNQITLTPNWYHEKYYTVAGETFKFTAPNEYGKDIGAIVVFDAEDNLIESVSISGGFDNFIYRVPNNAKRILFSYPYIKGQIELPSIEKHELMHLSNGEFMEIPEIITYTNRYININGDIAESSDYAIAEFTDVIENDEYRFTAFSNAQYVSAIEALGVNDEIMELVGGKNVYDNYVYKVKAGTQRLLFSFAKNYNHRIEKRNIADFKKCISCVGDSLTRGNHDGTGNTYPKYLNTLLGSDYVVKNHGCGGDWAEAIAASCGAYSMMAEPFTIPSDTSPVNFELKVPTLTYSPYGVTPMYQSLYEMTLVKIGGVIGNMRYMGRSGIYSFTRWESGESVTLTRPTPIITQRMSEKQYTTVIWAGTNNTPSVATLANTIDSIQAIIDTLPHDRYIVVGLTSKNYMPEVEEVNLVLERKFGKHFVDVRTYLLRYGLEDNNMSPTEQDNIDIANGEIPTSLRTDTVHLRYTGHKVVANQIYQKGKELGYW